MASLPDTTRQWLFQNHPKENAILEGLGATFKLVATNLPRLEEGQLLVKTIFISNDAAQRVWIAPAGNRPRLYVPPVKIGDVMRASALGEVVESRSATIPKGSIVKVYSGWTEYAVVDANKCLVVPPSDKLSITHHLGALGITGLTAYYGLLEIVRTTKDDTVVISGAAGATGSMAVQVAKKIIGCKKVIGIAGTDDKCRFVERLGADQCINYKSPTFHEDLAKATEEYVDVFFDNVGGSTLDLMISRMKLYGRIALCGAISKYNNISSPTNFNNFEDVITQRLELRGFVVLDFLSQLPKVVQEFTQAAEEGKIQIGDENETVVSAGFEEVPKVWSTLYDGSNQGKLITKL